jgi:thiamine-monophosphate kinase
VTNRTVSDIGERALISRITARLAMPPWVLVGPGDDAAVMQPERGTLEVLTTDALVEGIHFDRRFVPPDAIGHRALAVNLSDLAAMGAAPRAALLSLVLPDDLAVDVLDGIVDGLIALASRHRVALVGGNITRSPRSCSGETPGPLMIDVTAIGSVKPRRVLTRGGARPGDEVFVTGTIGGAAAGLRSLQAKAGGPEGPPVGPSGVQAHVEADLQVGLYTEKYLRPEPRVRVGVLLGRNRAASACIDLSDGLADGLRQLAAASRVGILVDEASIPMVDGVAEFHSDDYELLFTVRPRWRGRLKLVKSQAGDLPITRIGTVTTDTRVVLRSSSGDRDLPAGYEHFR